MSLVLISVISICVSAGVLLLLSRDLFRIIMGLAILSVAANLTVYTGARPDSLVPAVMEIGQTALSYDATSPLPQALVLTAIVIGFALLCFALLLAAKVSRMHGHMDVSKYHDSEPASPVKNQNISSDSKSDNKPTIMELE
jgi:multicomponent Na+:H+ antiporter subunit C